VGGNRGTGCISPGPSGRGPIKDEAFIEFKDDEKTNPYKLSASDLKSFVVGRDSFVVAHAPRNTEWSKKELDFVMVELDEDTKLYVARVGTYYGGKSRGISAHPEGDVGIGTGGYGGYGGVGGGIGIDLGGGGGGMGKAQTTYYYGANTAEMEMVTPQNFEDVMSDIMGDIPELLERIRDHEFNLGNVQKLIAYFKEAKAQEAANQKTENPQN
ncbi:MAG: hypothetical protein JSU01_07270, partial [Bacteroidetes bacterium]|nr:hypothetical protein [Bacteroidota bacterium]